MIYELVKEKDEFKQISPLLVDYKNHPILNGITYGYNKGHIYVDNPNNPRCALVWAEQEIFYLLGDPTSNFVSSLPTFIKEVIAPEAEQIGDDFFQVELLPESKWKQVVEEQLQMFIPKPYTRVTFTFDPESYNKLSKPNMPDEVTVERITIEMLSDKKFAMVRDDIVDFWESTQDFIRNGFGYVVMVHEQVVTSCLSVFATDTDVEIGINTYDLFQRGKGYAWLAARAFLEDCLRQGRTPHWKTEDFRIPSIKLAGKVGFTNLQTYTAYVFPYNELDNFVFTAYHQLRYYSNFNKASEFVQKARTLGDLNAWHHFLLSCGYSLIDRIDLSLKHMNLALDLGWNDVSDIRYVVDLVNLRKTEEGRALLDRVEDSLR
ncbi:GNAT family N-acetyltransferase [Bacillus cereus group sp. BfR-BA-01524]|uniref:GNAT family N-acetyltransferase n=1 Tax=Bacillus cereus group sp. BfR-BA-01524 TaxID=2920372 RepID=UPI001F568A96